MLCSEASIPGSVLLGYANADHLAVAQSFSGQSSPVLAGLIGKNDYPRMVRLETVVRFVEQNLAEVDSTAGLQ